MRSVMQPFGALLGLLLCAISPSVRSNISICTSTININGKNHDFHVDDREKLEEYAAAFCMQNMVANTECKKVIEHHENKCFNGNPVNQVMIESNGDSASVGAELPREDAQQEIRNSKVDYSQKVGPVFELVVDGQRRQLQTYNGESPEKAVNRFCKMFRIQNVGHCDEVRKRFLMLHGLEWKGGEAISKTAPENPSGSRDTDFYSLYKEMEAYIRSVLSQYWKWIVVAAASLMTLLEQRII